MRGAGKPWKKGQSGNPKGAPVRWSEISRIREESARAVLTLFNKYLNFTKDELNNVLRDPNSTMLELCSASVIAKIALTADQQRFDFILNRLIGKAPDININQTKLTNDIDDDLIDIPREALYSIINTAKDRMKEIEHRDNSESSTATINVG
jgi:hypothetical protein